MTYHIYWHLWTCSQLVLFLPALCRKMGVPYCIVKGKARLGRLVRRKTCTSVALTNIEAGDRANFTKVCLNHFCSQSCVFMHPIHVSVSWGDFCIANHMQHVTQKCLKTYVQSNPWSGKVTPVHCSYWRVNSWFSSSLVLFEFIKGLPVHILFFFNRCLK